MWVLDTKHEARHDQHIYILKSLTMIKIISSVAGEFVPRIHTKTTRTLRQLVTKDITKDTRNQTETTLTPKK